MKSKNICKSEDFERRFFFEVLYDKLKEKIGEGAYDVNFYWKEPPNPTIGVRINSKANVEVKNIRSFEKEINKFINKVAKAYKILR